MLSAILKFHEINLDPLSSWFKKIHWKMILSNFEEDILL